MPISDPWLFGEISAVLSDAELGLMGRVLVLLTEGRTPTPQSEEGVTSYPRRGPWDSEPNP